MSPGISNVVYFDPLRVLGSRCKLIGVVRLMVVKSLIPVQGVPRRRYSYTGKVVKLPQRDSMVRPLGRLTCVVSVRREKLMKPTFNADGQRIPWMLRGVRLLNPLSGRNGRHASPGSSSARISRYRRPTRWSQAETASRDWGHLFAAHRQAFADGRAAAGLRVLLGRPAEAAHGVGGHRKDGLAGAVESLGEGSRDYRRADVPRAAGQKDNAVAGDVRDWGRLWRAPRRRRRGIGDRA